MNKIYEDLSHLFSRCPLPPHEVRVIRFNWSEIRRTIPREKNENILSQKEGKDQGKELTYLLPFLKQLGYSVKTLGSVTACRMC